MAVKARLDGHAFDLDTLCELFAAGDPQVNKESDGLYYLASCELDGLIDDAGPLVETASLLLRRVVGVARALDSSFRPVTLTSQFTDDSGGGKRHHVVAAATMEIRARMSATGVVTAADQSPPPPPPPPQGPMYMELIKAHADVAEVLDILGRPSVSMTWVDLYKVYEIVRHNVGSDKALKGKGWVPDSDISAFTGSANRPDVSGSEARHARLPGAFPKRTMTLAEGEAFIRTLVVAWWDSLSPSS
ncbi:hypothetical protein [Streptomyces sp. NPDC059215]|uniref:hypothetical protein n=1 Tax=Streptomyces sp. NPDC059215 TaxID=3346772 RepID=UPI0036926404